MLCSAKRLLNMEDWNAYRRVNILAYNSNTSVVTVLLIASINTSSVLLYNISCIFLFACMHMTQ